MKERSPNMGSSAYAPVFPIRAQREREKVRRCRVAVRLTLSELPSSQSLNGESSQSRCVCLSLEQSSEGICIRT